MNIAPDIFGGNFGSVLTVLESYEIVIPLATLASVSLQM